MYVCLFSYDINIFINENANLIKLYLTCAQRQLKSTWQWLTLTRKLIGYFGHCTLLNIVSYSQFYLYLIIIVLCKVLSSVNSVQ